jgi:hypothetical protein
MAEALFQALAAGLHIWENDQKTKYVDRLLKLKKQWSDEYAKDADMRDWIVLDSVERELCIIASEWSTILGIQNSPH